MAAVKKSIRAKNKSTAKRIIFTAPPNVGTAGGMDSKVDLFDTVISTQAAYHDVDDGISTEFHPWLSSIYFNTNKDLLDIAKTIYSKCSKIHFGRMITGGKFIEDNMPFIAIRSITDTATHTGIMSFEKNCKQASIIAKDITLSFLKELSNQAK